MLLLLQSIFKIRKNLNKFTTISNELNDQVEACFYVQELVVI